MGYIQLPTDFILDFEDKIIQIRDIRDRYDITLHDLSHLSGVCWKHINKIELGIRTPSYKNSVRLARTLDMIMLDPEGIRESLDSIKRLTE